MKNGTVTLKDFWQGFENSKINSWGKVIFVSGTILSAAFVLGAQFNELKIEIKDTTKRSIQAELDNRRQDSLLIYQSDRYFQNIDGVVLKQRLDDMQKTLDKIEQNLSRRK